MNIEFLPAFEYQRMRWKNGLGWTREILREPQTGDTYDWRLSIAEIDHDCPFSPFPGLSRMLVLLEGAGMRLDFSDGHSVTLNPPHERVEFSGDVGAQCVLLEGPTRDFNLIWNPQRVAASLQRRPLVGSMVFFAEPGAEWVIYLLSGQAYVGTGAARIDLAAGDSLRLRPEGSSRALIEGGGSPVLLEDGGSRALLEGGGELLVIRISPQGAVLTPTA